MSAWPPVISQIGYPGAGDIDDCWAVATIWAAVASDPYIEKPTVPEFRAYAHNPDKPGPTGGDNDDCYQGSRFWHGDPECTRWETMHWDSLAALIKAGRPCSLAVNSGLLPPAHRYGFHGSHRIGAVWDGKNFLVMNPLAKSGAPLKPIREADLERAAVGLLPSGRVLAVLFPNPNDLHLRYGGVKTVPYPDRARTDQFKVHVHSRPETGMASVVRTIETPGTLWISYQKTTKGDPVTEGGIRSTTWYGNKAGDRWVNSHWIKHEGGAT